MLELLLLRGVEMATLLVVSRVVVENLCFPADGSDVSTLESSRELVERRESERLQGITIKCL